MVSSTTITQLPDLAGLNTFTRSLSSADIKSCVAVENTFPKQERCSEEKFQYHLTMCPELTLGLFINTSSTSPVLIGHVIATRSSATRVTDGSMEMPANWQSLPVDKVASVNGRIIGSEPIGGSVAVNSLAVVRILGVGVWLLRGS
ncbi:hypothetical protein BDV29DRAFT_155822 [Aspergillus leporis]|uniref:Uncharacterized protein n=1 Tax=Aspergillus leporis TaxID=41062 RepID=A0A5N5X3G2_9EURO|nr:hypothetical protein BDV29DRAFT_155822 [Aspergillus leporis]